MEELPDEPVALAPAESRLGSGRSNPVQSAKLLAQAEEEQKDKAAYKIEVIFHRDRSTLLHKSTALMVLIWESGKRLHGGGDEKMYWCGYDKCGKPIPSGDFGFMHVVCRSCKREQFLDQETKVRHIKHMERELNKSSSELKAMPLVVGEKLARLTPSKLAELLERTFLDLDSKADIYFKYSPYEIRWDIKHETVGDLDKLDKARAKREPLIYTLKAIRKDLASGTNLRSRFLAMITA